MFLRDRRKRRSAAGTMATPTGLGACVFSALAPLPRRVATREPSRVYSTPTQGQQLVSLRQDSRAPVSLEGARVALAVPPTPAARREREYVQLARLDRFGTMIASPPPCRLTRQDPP